jgi:hypothetical protein
MPILQILFSLTLFLSAGLLFLIQLLASKMLLPILGGSASVWNTCLMFFQISLLLGYLYAHIIDHKLTGRMRVFLHPILLLLAGVVLPVSLHNIPMPLPGMNPSIWLVRILALVVGPPFLILAGTAPLLQSWFAQAHQKSSRDPYYLYVASNLGSLLALVSYPTLIEPHFRLVEQSHFWAIGYFFVLGLSLICGICALRKSTHRPVLPMVSDVISTTSFTKPSLWRRLKWIFLAFIPSSLLLGITTHITQDVAAAPLFWVFPLILYLLTFILAFQRLFRIPQCIVAFLQAACLIGLVFLSLVGITGDVLLFFAVLAFFLTALLCHQELAASRPESHYLTGFYLFLSLGGALGGTFNALIAPLVFTSATEFPLVMALACFVRPGSWPSKKAIWKGLGDFILPVVVGLAVIILNHHSGITAFDGLQNRTYWLAGISATLILFAFLPFIVRGLTEYSLSSVISSLLGHGNLSRRKALWKLLEDFLFPALIALAILLLEDRYLDFRYMTKETYVVVFIFTLIIFVFQFRCIRFGLGFVALIIASSAMGYNHHTIFQCRNFYGIFRIQSETAPPYHYLFSGTTLHGTQALDAQHILQPLSYYHPRGPLGQLFAAIQGTHLTDRVAIVGLGAGSVACYEKPGEHWTFYEINPADISIAQNPKFFTFLRDCPAHPDIRIGDARLSLGDEPDHSYSMIILDAFSSDAIPVHLLTREAVQLYLRKLRPDGIIIFHISNLYLNLEPVVGNVAGSLKLVARYWEDDENGDDKGIDSPIYQKESSEWAIMAPSPDNLSSIKDDKRWKVLLPSANAQEWTDDYSDIFGAIRPRVWH